MTCDELDELAGALALGAALPEEIAMAREHLASCARGHQQVARLISMAAMLAELPEPVEPPPGLRARILAAARAEPRQPPRDLATVGIPPHPSGPEPPAPIAIGARTRSRPRLASSGWWAAAAVLLLAVGLGAWNLRLRHDVAVRDDQLAAREQAISSLAGARSITPFSVAAPLAGAHGVLVQGPGVRPVVVLNDLTRPANGDVYQLWALDGNGATDLGIFRPGGDGRAVVTLPDLGGADAVAVTIEQRREPQPTGAPVLQASLT